jgi:peptide/nickel transport system ATP-binding protein
MYLGKVVEEGPVEELILRPKHPYTAALISSIPKPNPKAKGEMVEIRGETPSPINPPTGCRYHTRCPFASELCSQKEPQLQELEVGHRVACHHPLEA